MGKGEKPTALNSVFWINEQKSDPLLHYNTLDT